MREKEPSNPDSNSRPKWQRALRELPHAVYDYVERQILEFARDSRRDPDEFKKPLLYRFGLEGAIAIAIFAFFATTFGPTIAFQLKRWIQSNPEISITESRWLVTYESLGTCDNILNSDCIGNLKDGSLWRSSFKASDEDYMDRVKDLRGKKFWIGLELNSSEVSYAIKHDSPILAVGMFNAGYRIFVNGLLVDRGVGDDISPVMVPLPIHDTANIDRIRIAVEVTHNLGSRIPFWLPDNMGGLFSYDSARASTGFWTAYFSFRPLILTSWAGLIALVFFSLWLSVPRKVEYFFFSLYLSVFSLNEILGFAPIVYGTRRDLLYKGTYWLVAWEGLAGCLLGAAYARVRKVYLIWILFIGSMVSVAGYLSSPDPTDIYRFKDALLAYYTPVLFVIGATFCFVQSISLGKDLPQFMNRRDREIRRHRLLVFGSLLTVFGIVFYIQSHHIYSKTPQALERSIQLGLIMVIGSIMFSEFRDRERQFSVVQRSPFHDPFGGKSDEVFGFLVSIDLIKSSLIANFSAEAGVETRAITTWNSLIGQVMARHYGFKVGDEGDGMKVFFKGSDCPENLAEVIDALVEAHEETVALSDRMMKAALVPTGARLEFRSGIVWGGINPIWKEFVGVKTPEWEDAKGLTTFKDSTRVMDIEKQMLIGDSHSSTVIIYSRGGMATGLSTYSFERFRYLVKDVGELDLLRLNLSELGRKVLAA